MSSIDKGVERVVHEMGRNIRVERRGNTIYGYSNGEVVFTLADRYGWINQEESESVKRQIRAFDSKKSRERALELERQRIENLRKQAVASLKNAINSKRSEINEQKNKDLSLIKSVSNSYNALSTKIESINKTSSILNVSSLKEECKKQKAKNDSLSNTVISEYNALTSELSKIESGFRESLSGVQAEKLTRDLNKISSRIKTKYDCSFDVEQQNKIVDAIIQSINRISKLINDLEKYSKGYGDTALIAKEAINTIKGVNIGSIQEVEKIAGVIQSGLESIKQTKAVEKREESLKELLELEGKIASCKELSQISVVGTYEVVEYRNKIVMEAADVIENFESLMKKEFTTAYNERINAVIDRATNIIKGTDSSEEVLKELKVLNSEYLEILQRDKLEEKNYQEYLGYKNKLIEYGVDSKDIPAFDYANYKSIRDNLTTMITIEKRNQQKTNMYLTNIETTKIMIEMGFELFASSGDKNGLVVETLFTKKGYDGVIWQIVVLADGSFNRRLLGVNKGDTQTDIEYIKEVAREFDESNEAVTFLQKFNESTGSNVLVNKAVEYNSNEVEQEIMKNGYHYLQGQAKENYDKQVKLEEKETNTVKKSSFKVKATQVNVTASNKVKNAASNLQASLQKSMAMAI